MAFAQAADHPAAAAVFSRLGNNITTHPWQYIPGNPTKSFNKARAAVS
jgi:hypothetical protein